MYNILVCDDEKDIVSALRIYLTAEGYRGYEAGNGREALEYLAKEDIHLVLMDIMMPEMDGITAMVKIREQSNVPVILLTANDTDLDIVDGLERGADDYITKPFSLSVLRARVNTQLRKQASNHKNAPFHMDLFHFDFEAMTFYVGDSKVELSKTEQKLLRLLVENRGRTMTRGDLVDRIWTDGAEYVDENALSVTIKRLRDKLGAQKYIKTVYGIGYSWVTKDE